MSRGPLFLGGLGHALCRLAPARTAARAFGFDVKEVLYPGFEGRPPSASFEDFLDNIESQVDVYRLSHARRLLVATDFGCLVALALRARGRFPDLPFVFLGAVPWRQVQTIGGQRAAGDRLRQLLRDGSVQARYVERHFQRPLPADAARAFFSGFGACEIQSELYDWLSPGWLADLEGRLAARPGALEGIAVWLGEEDRLVDVAELDATERALGVRWPRAAFEGWGHFPYLDDPLGWIEAVHEALAP